MQCDDKRMNQGFNQTPDLHCLANCNRIMS